MPVVTSRVCGMDKKPSVDELVEGVGKLGLRPQGNGKEEKVVAKGEEALNITFLQLEEDDDHDSNGGDHSNNEAETEEEEEECIQGLVIRGHDDEDGGDDGHYTAKGPIRGAGAAGVTGCNSGTPYARAGPGCVKDRQLQQQQQQLPEQQPVPVGHFLENFEGVEFEDFSEISGIPGLPMEPKLPGVENQLLLSSIDDMFGGNHTGSRIILRNESTNVGFSFLPASFSIKVDHKTHRIGIDIPRKVIPAGCIPPNADMAETMDIHIQLDSKTSRIIKVSANIEESKDELLPDCWVIKPQFLKLEPFADGSGISALLEGVSEDEIDRAIGRVRAKSLEELLKSFGPQQENILNCLCCREDQPSLRAEVLAVTQRLLASTDPAVRRNVLRKNSIGLSALDYSCFTNKTSIARFLVEVFYDMGEDVTSTEENGNSVLHVMARKGDEVANTLEMLLQLGFRGNSSSDGSKKVYASGSRNKSGEMPIHVAAMNSRCHQRTVQLLHQDMPECLKAKAADGNLPIHQACQFSNDPALIALLLYYNRGVVNSRRTDGCTPLHLVASRGDVTDRAVKLFCLDEDTQIRMINLLLQHGADKASTVQQSYMPVHLVPKNRTRVKLLLNPKRNSGGSRHNSPPGGSPPGRDSGYMTNLRSSSLGSQSPAASNSSGFESDMSPMAFNDGYVSGCDSSSGGSPGAAQAHVPVPSPFGNGSLTSGGESDSEEPNQDLDAIAEVLYQHPAIQAIMGSFPN